MNRILKKPKGGKPPKSIRRLHKKIGDIIEVPTSKGLAYVQYTHEYTKPPNWGSLIRVLQGFYKERPSNEKLEKLVKKPHRFQTFCPIYRVVNIGDWERVGNFPVPKFALKFPVFKNMKYLFKRPSAEEAIWYLWDGERSWKAGKLSLEEQKKYPDHILCNDTALIYHIETGLSAGRTLC